MFTDITEVSGLPTRSSPCLVIADFDLDGTLDILLDQDGLVDDDGQLQVYLGSTSGRYVEKAIPLPRPGSAHYCAAGDFDRDGLTDLVIGLEPAGFSILHNEGGLAFVEVAGGILAGTGTTAGAIEWTGRPAVGFFDYDADGWLDVFASGVSELGFQGDQNVCEFPGADFACGKQSAHRHAGRPPILLRNDQGRFEPQPDAFAAPYPTAWTNAVAFVDYDLDGFVDIFMANDYGFNVLYLNQGGSGAFVEASATVGLDRYNHAMGVAFADVNGDAQWDVYLADLGPDQFHVSGPNGPKESADELGIWAATRHHSGWAPVVEDFDHDGILDVFVVNSLLVDSDEELVDSVSFKTDERIQPDFLFVGEPDGTYVARVVEQTIPRKPVSGTGAVAAADLDGDGDLDLLEAYGAFPIRLRLLRNDMAAPDSAHVIELRGSAANPAGLGSRLTLHFTDGSLQMKTLGASSGSLGCSWPRAHVAPGPGRRLDAIDVVWPGGMQQSLQGPWAPGERIEIQQP